MPGKAKTKGERNLKEFRDIFPILDRPRKVVVFPKNLSGLSSEKVSDIMVHYSEWKEYLEDVKIDAYVELAKAKEAYEKVYNAEYATQSGRNREEREAKVLSTRNVSVALREYNDADRFYQSLLTKIDSIKDSIATISREISRRQSQM